jgi:hypothetical protein
MPEIVFEKGKVVELIPYDNNSWMKTLRRVHFNGEPITGKTTALTTMPAMRHIMIAPGEQGYSSLQENDEQKVYKFVTDPTELTDYAGVWKVFQEMAKRILSNEFGQVTVFAIDGLHKLYYMLMKNRGFPTNTDMWGDKAYGKGYDYTRMDFENFMNPILASNIPYVAATSYDRSAAIEKGSKDLGMFPDFPGQMARNIMGMFPVTIHTKRVPSAGVEKFFWELKATPTLRGVGVHVPLALKKQLPPFCEPNWAAFEKLLIESAVPIEKKIGGEKA